jgi:hypothetical protein
MRLFASKFCGRIFHVAGGDFPLFTQRPTIRLNNRFIAPSVRLGFSAGDINFARSHHS